MITHAVGTHLIHILAKQDTPMKARRTVLGFEPAKLKTRVIRIRSMLVLLRADDMVNPPMSNIIVGENMTENTNLYQVRKIPRIRGEPGRTDSVACFGVSCSPRSPGPLMALRQTSNRGTMSDVTNNGMACSLKVTSM